MHGVHSSKTNQTRAEHSKRYGEKTHTVKQARRACLCPPHACGLNLTPPDLVTCAPLPACPEQFSTSVPAMKHAQPTGKPRRDNLQARARLASTLAHNPWIALASPHSRGCASGHRARRYPIGLSRRFPQRGLRRRWFARSCSSGSLPSAC